MTLIGIHESCIELQTDKTKDYDVTVGIDSQTSILPILLLSFT
jgi:hypothetical protein